MPRIKNLYFLFFMREAPINLDLKIPADLRFSAGVREFIDEFCLFCEFERTTCNQIKLIIDELFMNAVRYGSGSNSDVKLTLGYHQNLLKGMIEDAGEGREQIKKEELEKIILTQTNNNVITKTSGRGLAQIVKRWTDKMEIKNNAKGGIVITFEKKIEFKKEAEKEAKIPLLKIQPNALKEYKFVFEGEIDEGNIKENKQIVNDFLKEKTDAIRIILDFSELHYCNSLFIGQIADWYNKMQKRNGEIVILNPNQDILNIIDMVGLTKVIPVQNIHK